MTVQQALARATQTLRESSSTPRLSSEVLLSYVLDVSRASLLAHPERIVSNPDDFFDLVDQHANHVPIAYLTGHKEFFDRDFMITPDVLVPRPETELLVETAISWIKKHATQHVADIGTGSGIIAIAIALECPDCQIMATDISEKALQVAKKNAKHHGVMDRIIFQHANLLDELPSTPDLIVSNPPYLSNNAPQDPSIHHEPQTALFADADGLDCIQKLIQQSTRAGLSTNPNRSIPLILEHDPRQTNDITCLAREHHRTVQTHKDLSKRDRVSVIV